MGRVEVHAQQGRASRPLGDGARQARGSSSRGERLALAGDGEKELFSQGKKRKDCSCKCDAEGKREARMVRGVSRIKAADANRTQFI